MSVQSLDEQRLRAAKSFLSAVQALRASRPADLSVLFIPQVATKKSLHTAAAAWPCDSKCLEQLAEDRTKNAVFRPGTAEVFVVCSVVSASTYGTTGGHWQD